MNVHCPRNPIDAARQRARVDHRFAFGDRGPKGSRMLLADGLCCPRGLPLGSALPGVDERPRDMPQSADNTSEERCEPTVLMHAKTIEPDHCLCAIALSADADSGAAGGATTRHRVPSERESGKWR
jgi:hypothetical protein